MTDSALPRFVGTRALALMIVTVTVGAGIFGMPALAAHDLGASAVLAYIVCAVIIALVGLCFAEAGSRVSGTGGLYAFAMASFGPFAGGMVGMLLLTANGAFSSAAVAALLADSLALLLPTLAAPMPRALLLITTYGVFATLNIRGAREGSAVTQLITVIKLLPLVILVMAGVFFIEPAMDGSTNVRDGHACVHRVDLRVHRYRRAFFTQSHYCAQFCKRWDCLHGAECSCRTTLRDGSGRVMYTPSQSYLEIVERMRDLEHFIDDDDRFDADLLVKMAIAHH